MDLDNLATYIQSIEDAAADMRSALDNYELADDVYERLDAREEIRDWAQQIEGHALDILDIINKDKD